VTQRTATLHAIVAVLLVVVPTVARPLAPAVAQASPARITLSAIDPVVVSGGDLRVAVTVERGATDGDAWADVTVVADLHAALGSRSALRAALDGGAVPRRVQRVVIREASAPSLGPGGVLRLAGAVPLSGAALSGTDTAVHPLRLTVTADGVDIGRLDTAVVRVGAAPSAPLATTLVWPIDAPPARDAAGDPAAVLDPHTMPGSRLDTLLTALTPAPAFVAGVTTTAPAHLLEDLARRSASVPAALLEDVLRDGPREDAVVDVDPAALRAAMLLERLRSTVGTLPGAPLVTPYADADVARLLASGPSVQPLAGRALVEGATRAVALVGRAPAPVVLLEAPVPPSLLDLLPARTVVLPYAAIDAPDLSLDIALDEPVRTLRSPTGRPVTALVGDPYVTSALGTSSRRDPGDPVRAAQDVLVRTAMIHLEAPGREGRSLVLLPPPGFDPDPRFAAELLARLGAAPWLTPTNPEALLAASSGTRVAARLPDVRVPPIADRLRDALIRTAGDLEVLVGAVDLAATGDGPMMVGDRVLRDASDELLRATSRRLDVDDALTLLGGVRAGVDRAFGTSSIAIEDVTLTDRDGTVPLAVTHVGEVPLRVRVEVSGPAALTWTDGGVRELTFAVDADAAQPLEVPVRSGATGRFPVRVRVTDPSGERLLASEVASVRATALATPALASIAATVVLLTVVGSIRQHRRGLRLRDASEGLDEGLTGGPTGTPADGPAETAR